MRINLRKERMKNGMTQQQVADSIGITITYYSYIELGKQTGSIKIWDKLEDLFGVNQRFLRENI